MVYCNMKKLQKWLILWSALLLTAFFQILYCREVVPRQVQLVQREIVLPSLPAALDGVRLALISDLHGDRQDIAAGLYRQGAELIRGARPDAVFFLGDYLNRFPAGENLTAEELVQIMEDFVPEGVMALAVTGNHDLWSGNQERMGALAGRLSGSRIRLLQNETVSWHLRGESLEIGGVEDTPECWANVGIFREKDRKTCRILLCHRPEYFLSIAHCADLMLSGHTHGGQIRFPILQERYRGSRWQENYFPAGLSRLEDGKLLYVTSGIGTSTLRLRMNCPPEVVVLTLRSGGNKKKPDHF